jgi:hypothetical protein
LDTITIVGVVEVETSPGNVEHFLPLLGLFVGDMMELLIAGRNMSANFSVLEKPCHICAKPGCQLSDLTPCEQRSLHLNNQVISAELDRLRSGAMPVLENLRKHSLLLSEVYYQSIIDDTEV